MSSPNPNPVENLDYDERADVARVHNSVRREKVESQGSEPVAPWSLIAAAAILIWGGAYVGKKSGPISMESYNIAGSAYVPDANPGGGADDGPQLSPFEKLMADGKKAYATCAGCHQPTGMGVPGQFPPLVDSPWVLGSDERLALIVLKGLNGPITVHGAQFNGVMPPQEQTMNDKAVAAVLTYVRNTWGNKAPIVTPEAVAHARDKYKDRAEPANVAFLETIPDDQMLPGPEVDPETGEPVGEGAADEGAAAQ